MSDDKPRVDVTKTKRKVLRASVTRDVSTADTKYSDVTADNCVEAEAFLERLKKHQSELSDLNQQMLSKADLEKEGAQAWIESELEAQSEYEEKLGGAINTLEIKIRRLSSSTPNQQVPQTTSFAKVKTPTLKLTEYEGDPLRWEEFWDDFSCSVDARTDLSTIDKFKLLKQSLKGEALSLADGYYLTQRNYQEVKAALEDRFGDPQVAIFAHFEALLELEPASHDVESLVRIRDRCEAHIRSLQALGLSEDTHGMVFAPILLSKLPRYVKMEMHRRNGSKLWTLKNLREHLKEEIQVRAKSDRSFAGSSDSPSTSKGNTKADRKSKTKSTASALFVHGKAKGQAKTSAKSKPQSTAKKCLFCEGDHPNYGCVKYPSVETRLPFVKGRCFACFSNQHTKKDCKSRKKCFYCHESGHNSSLCPKKFGDTSDSRSSDFSGIVQSLNPRAPEFVPIDAVNAVHSQGSKSFQRTGTAVLESASVQVLGPKGSARARVIFDNGSTMSFVRSGLAKMVGAKILGQDRTTLSRFGDNTREDRKYPVVQLHVILRDGSKLVLWLHQVDIVSAPVRLVPIPLESVAPVFQADDFPDLVENPCNADIDILLGLDHYYDIVGPEIWRSGSLVVKQTSIGKILSGFVRNDDQQSISHQMLIMASTESEKDLLNLERFWGIEEIGLVDKTSQLDDEAAVELFNSSVRFVDGRYEVKWPFKHDPPNLPNNFQLARRRLVSTHRRLVSTPNLLETYHAIFQDQINKGVIELAPAEADGPIHYLPHHAVVLPSRETTKVRLVFDASSKPNSQFQSLNESMYRGPVFLSNLVGLLLRFRCPKYAVTSDVEKAFLQISLHVSHRDCTRFLWLQDPNKPPTADNLLIYRYARVMFGAKASPFLLSGTVIHHMKQANTVVSNKIIDSTYMDNIIGGESTLDSLLSYQAEAKELLSEMHMKLHQWYSNCREFLEQIPEDERGTRKEPSVLGLKWNLDEDTLSCTVGRTTISPVTKRNALKCTASVYDPCGWFSAATIGGKMLIQEFWKGKFDWDQEVSEDLRGKWAEVSACLGELGSYKLPRRYSWPAESLESAIFDLHVFCDASTKAYCAAVYLRVQGPQEVFCDILFARCRVAPVKTLTVPKLELKAAKTGKELISFVEQHLRLPIRSKTLWTDSVCVLCWIQGQKVTTPFVQSNVRQIRSDTQLEFRYVPSEDNPADVGSRGISFTGLVDHPTWWHGPSWLLSDESKWPEHPHRISSVVADAESAVHLVAETEQEEQLFDLRRYSTLSKLLRVTAYFRRARQRFKRNAVSAGALGGSEIKEALIFWEHRTQKQMFGPLFQQNQTAKWKNFSRQLGLFVDADEYIRCRGRFHNSPELSLDSKHPILLPKRHLFTQLVVFDLHAKVMHSGVKHTLARVRERYWIPQGRSRIKTILRSCQRCRIQSGGPFPVPNPPPLPEFRVAIKQPFACVGLDYLGPLFVKEGAETKKVWIALFTCAVVRAIHLEVVQSLSAVHFLLALRRFAALYGKPEVIVSDNARQFKAAEKLLRKEIQDVSENPEVSGFLSNQGIAWKFIVERAPWMGGFYERLVATVKDALKKTVGRWTLTSEELHTVCYEISFVVNSRPLVYSDDDPSDQVITPLHLLFRSSCCFADSSGEQVFNDQLTKADELLAHWRAGQNLLRQFWDMWKTSYLLSLREFSRNPRNRAVSDIPVKIGVVVLIKENLPRGQWKVGRITRVHESGDGEIRSVSVRLPSGNTLVRPIKLLYPIEGQTSHTQVAQSQDDQQSASQTTAQTTVDPSQNARPRRRAAQTANQLTRQMLACVCIFFCIFSKVITFGYALNQQPPLINGLVGIQLHLKIPYLSSNLESFKLVKILAPQHQNPENFAFICKRIYCRAHFCLVLCNECVAPFQDMPRIIEIVPGHPLSMNHTYSKGLALQNIRITCIRQGYHYVKLLQHRQAGAAKELLTNPTLMWNPDKVLSFSSSCIKEENVNFLCNSGEVMRSVLVEQILDPDNPFRSVLEDEIKLADEPRSLEFRVYNSNREMIFTSGFRYGEWKSDVPGFHVYSDLLKDLVLMIIGDIPAENPLMDEMLNNYGLFDPIISRSLLLVGDSEMRNIDNIQCGDVVPVSGGKYGSMVDVLKSPKFPLSDYKWIAVYCGINCNVKRSYAFTQQDKEWQALKNLLIAEASTRDKPSVLFCPSFDHPTANRDNRGHVAAIRQQLEGTRVICVDWNELGDPFLLRKGSLNYQLFNVKGKNPKAWPSEIHINKRGTRVVWKEAFCRYLEGLKFIHYTEGKTPQSIPKLVFSTPLLALPAPTPEDDEPGPSHRGLASKVVVAPNNDQRRVVLPNSEGSAIRRSPPRPLRLGPVAPVDRRAEDQLRQRSPPRHSRPGPSAPAGRRAEDSNRRASPPRHSRPGPSAPAGRRAEERGRRRTPPRLFQHDRKRRYDSHRR